LLADGRYSEVVVVGKFDSMLRKRFPTMGVGKHRRGGIMEGRELKRGKKVPKYIWNEIKSHSLTIVAVNCPNPPPTYAPNNPRGISTWNAKTGVTTYTSTINFSCPEG